MGFFTPPTEQEIAEMREYVRTHDLDHQYDDCFDGVPFEQEKLRSYILVLEALGRMPN
ncbi:MAG: hypothetical protein PHO10_11160 [Gemmiger sp.]|nr:hypothetical protein [Gemmiger sp.]